MTNIHSIYLYFQKRFRPSRMKRFYKAMNITPETNVLDAGGTLLNWSFIDVIPNLTILNIHPPQDTLPPRVKWVIGNAMEMEFKDNSFDVVFSNSVIEHLGSWQNCERFAKEIRRVGKCYFVQTPNYWFPVEPHFLTPFIHWLPRRIGKALLPITVHSIITGNRELTRIAFDEVKLIKPYEMKMLFPDAEVVYEKVMGLPKAIIAIKK